jgi:hypothetical protein
VDEVTEKTHSKEHLALVMTLQAKIPPSTGGGVEGYWTEYEIVERWKALQKEMDVDLKNFHKRWNLEVEDMLV